MGLIKSSPVGLFRLAASPRMSRAPSTQGDRYDSILAVNLRLLIERQAGGSVNAWATRTGLNQSTVNRIANGTRDATVSQLELIEEKTGYAPWQLLHPDFDPLKMPPMMEPRAMRIAAIFAALSEADRRKAESIMEILDGASVQREAVPTPSPAVHR